MARLAIATASAGEAQTIAVDAYHSVEDGAHAIAFDPRRLVATTAAMPTNRAVASPLLVVGG
jgi:hypothetical protein